MPNSQIRDVAGIDTCCRCGFDGLGPPFCTTSISWMTTRTSGEGELALSKLQCKENWFVKRPRPPLHAIPFPFRFFFAAHV